MPEIEKLRAVDVSTWSRGVLILALLAGPNLACEDELRPRRARVRVPTTNTSSSADAAVAVGDANLPNTGADAGTVTPPPIDAGTTPPPTGPGELVKGLDIAQVAIYQGVKITLVEDGTAIRNRNAPVVQNREALMRVFVRPQSEWTARSVVARLELSGSPFGTHEIRATKRVSSASSDSFLASSINFEIPAMYMVSNLTWSVSLEEESAGTGNGNSDFSRFPVSGEEAMNAYSSGEKVIVVLVPIQYNSDGSGRLPSTTPDQIERYRKGMYTMFPTPEVEIVVREPFAWNRAVESFGNGWSDLLQAILNLRRNERMATNVYYYGIVTPSDSLASFCNRGCVAGLSSLSSDPENDYVRGSIGLGYDGDNAVGTFVHEVGHAHGRRHAPCGLGRGQQSDPGYPYNGGTLGVWGYDLDRKILIDPNEYKDLMSYCDPRWISDYQYDALFERISAVNQLAFRIPGPESNREWTSVIIGMDGTPRWGTDVDPQDAFGGQLQEVNFLNLHGQISAQESAHYFPFSHIEGGLLLLPKPADHVRSIRMPNGRILMKD